MPRSRDAAGRDQEITTLEELLDRVEETASVHERTSIGDVLDVIGARSFGALLLLPGLVMVAPVVGDIPGVPVLMGFIVLLTAAQMLLRRDHVWLPDWLQRRSVDRSKTCTAVRWLRPVGRFLDRCTRRRLTGLVRNGGRYLIATACIVIAVATPLMEVVLFSANVAGAAIVAFGLSLIAHDGLMAVIAAVFTAGTFGAILYLI